MSVNYSIVCKDGEKATVSSVCFGKMNVSRWHEQSAINGNQQVLNRGSDTHAFISLDCKKNIHPFWIHPVESDLVEREWTAYDGDRPTQIKNASLNFLRAMSVLLEDMPMLKGLVTVHPLLGLVRVYIKEHTADQIMAALYLFRNLNQYSNYAGSYRKMIQSGYRPRFAAIFAHMLPGEIGPSLMGRTGAFNVANAQIGEYNWFNPNTFGKQAFLKLMTQDGTEGNWKLQKWNTQAGYRRDNYFSTNGIMFDTRYGDHGCRLNYWHMVDCLCIPGDEPLTLSHDWNNGRGFKFKHVGMNSDNDYIGSDLLEEILRDLEELCNDNSIQIRA